MDSIRVFCDSIKNVVNVSCQCAKAKPECPTNEYDVIVVGIIAVAVFLVVLCICLTVRNIILTNKHNGIKSIVEKILKEREKQDKANGKQA